MLGNVLVCDPSQEYCQKAQECLIQNDYHVDIAINGRDAQLKCYKNNYFAVILDMDTQAHSAIEVLKYLRINASQIKVLFTVESHKRLKELELTKKDLLDLGASDILIKPYGPEQLLKSLKGSLQFELYQNINTKKDQRAEESEITARDDLFTRIKAKEFYSGNSSIFDIYVKLNPNRYIKILHRGDFFSQERMNRYINEKKIEYFYFKTKDRALYVHYLNELSEKLLKHPNTRLIEKVTTIKSLAEKYIEEIYVEGLQPQLVDEGMKLCDNIYAIIQKEKDLYKVIRNLEDEHYNIHTHSFLVMFFSSMICKYLGWTSTATVRKVSIGSMLHDIGKLKLDPLIRDLIPSKMEPPQLEQYKKHPKLAIEMVSQSNIVTTEIQDIIIQHHEKLNGEGFPEGLPGIKIYPLAQIVAFVNYLTKIMAEHQKNPIESMKIFLQDPQNLDSYNPKMVKTLVKCFINPDSYFKID